MTSVSKNVYIDKLVDIANEYNNTYHKTIKMKPVLLKSGTDIDFCMKISSMQKLRNTKIFLQNVMFQIGLKKFL